MDQKYQGISGDSVVVTGIGVEAPVSLESLGMGKEFGLLEEERQHDCSPLEFLKQKKTLKFMSKQDRLAVNAAGQAIRAAGLNSDALRQSTSVFLTVGYIPFEFEIAADLCSASVDVDTFSMDKFSTAGIDNINPLIAFACLPNMPAHHIAMNFGIHGGYQITYPDILQFYLGLEEAVNSLVERETTYALTGGVADQNNFLVKHHFHKRAPALSDSLVDSAAFMVLELESLARTRNIPVLARLDSMQVSQSYPLALRADLVKNVVQYGPAQMIMELLGFLNSNKTTFMHDLKDLGNETCSSWVKT